MVTKTFPLFSIHVSSKETKPQHMVLEWWYRMNNFGIGKGLKDVKMKSLSHVGVLYIQKNTDTKGPVNKKQVSLTGQ